MQNVHWYFLQHFSPNVISWIFLSYFQRFKDLPKLMLFISLQYFNSDRQTTDKHLIRYIIIMSTSLACSLEYVQTIINLLKSLKHLLHYYFIKTSPTALIFCSELTGILFLNKFFRYICKGGVFFFKYKYLAFTEDM